jgi:predicted metal-dependent enzyme (double-stranded beta helix superfamily)
MDTTLKAFINRLETLSDKISPDVLKKCVSEMDVRKLPIEEYVIFSDQGYKRNIVHVSSKCEVTVLCFMEGQATPIHDHGGSTGITIIRDGIMTEELFNKRSTGMIAPKLKHTFQKNELSPINLTTIHRVSNAHTEGLVTINIYFPPLTLMNIYNLKDTNVGKWTADYVNKVDCADKKNL